MRANALLLSVVIGWYSYNATAAVDVNVANTQIVRLDPGLDELIAPGTPDRTCRHRIQIHRRPDVAFRKVVVLGPR